MQAHSYKELAESGAPDPDPTAVGSISQKSEHPWDVLVWGSGLHLLQNGCLWGSESAKQLLLHLEQEGWHQKPCSFLFCAQLKPVLTRGKKSH